MFKFINQVWLQLRLLISFFTRKTMIVTQKNIDDAIELANASKRALYIKIQAELETGCRACKDDLQLYLDFDNAVWLLESSSIFVEQDCIETSDIWTQINFIRANSCTLPKKPIIERIFTWLITNTGLDILTNNNKQIITT